MIEFCVKSHLYKSIDHIMTIVMKFIVKKFGFVKSDLNIIRLNILFTIYFTLLHLIFFFRVYIL